MCTYMYVRLGTFISEGLAVVPDRGRSEWHKRKRQETVGLEVTACFSRRHFTVSFHVRHDISFGDSALAFLFFFLA